MARQNQNMFVQTVYFLHGKGPVFYASLPWGPEQDQKHHLISGLWDHLVAVKNPFWMTRPCISKEAFPIQNDCSIRADQFMRGAQIIRSPLGRPQLLLGRHRGPAISFSENDQTLWAALCGDEHDIGIDVVHPDEFQGKYPFYRVFHPPELAHAVKLLGEDLKKAAALLWSIKEAVVKALGCAFHLVDPLQVIVYPSIAGTTRGAATENSSYDFPVGLSEKAAKQFPMASGRTLRVRSVFLGNMWLSIALLNWQRHSDDRENGFDLHNSDIQPKIRMGAL